MNHVKIQYDDREVVLDNVTRVLCSLAFSPFENVIRIYQGEKETLIKESEIISLDVEVIK